MKNNRWILSFLLTILILTVSVTAYGIGIELPEPSKYFYVYDEANILDSELENYIISINEQLFNKTGAQIVVATVNSLNDSSEQELAISIFRKWGIGSKGKNNGILMLISPNDQRLWIEVGYGLEGALPDGKVGEIRDKDIFPYFREGDYNTGILKGFDSILSIVAREYDIENSFDISGSPNNNIDYSDNKDVRIDGIRMVLIAIGVIVFLFIDFKFFGGMLTIMLLRSASRGGRGGRGGGSGGNRGGGGSSGGGGAGGGW